MGHSGRRPQARFGKCAILRIMPFWHPTQERGLWVTDICVPISKLADAVEQTSAEINQSGIAGPIMGHVGDGNFHAILMIDPDKPDDLKTAKNLSERMVTRALEMGGNCDGRAWHRDWKARTIWPENTVTAGH